MMAENPKTIALISGLLQPRHMADEFHQQIFSTCLELWSTGQPVNTVTVNHSIAVQWKDPTFRGPTHPTPLSYLSGLMMYGGYGDSAATHWTAIIREAYSKRRMVGALTDGIYHLLGPGADANQISADIVEGLLLDEKGGQLTRLAADILTGEDQLAAEIIARLEDPTAIYGIRTGWKVMDEIIGGFEDGRTYTFLASTSVGKSWWVHWLTLMIAKLGSRPVIFSTEMGRKEVLMRLAFMEAGLDWFQIRKAKVATADQKERAMDAMDRISKLPIGVCAAGGMDINVLVQEIRRQQMSNKVNMVFVDHIQDLTVRGIPSHLATQRVESVTKAMKAAAMNLRIPIGMVSHVGRASIAEGGRPGLNSGLNSGSIERDSDAVMSLVPVIYDDENGAYRMFDSQEELQRYRDKYNRVSIEVRFEKSRSGGAPHQVMVLDWGQGGKFIPVARED